VKIIQGDLGRPAHVFACGQGEPSQDHLSPGGDAFPSANAVPRPPFPQHLGIYHAGIGQSARRPPGDLTSTMAYFWPDIKGTAIDDYTRKRPITMYGSTKVFADCWEGFTAPSTTLTSDAFGILPSWALGPRYPTYPFIIAWPWRTHFTEDPYEIFVNPRSDPHSLLQGRCPER